MGGQQRHEAVRQRGRSSDADGIVAPIVDQLATALRERGLDVATNVGQSAFRCDLAVRRPGQPAYDVAVLIDHVERVDSQAFHERRLTQPAALCSAGWRVVQVLSTEWLSRPDVELDAIVDRLAAPRDAYASGDG